MATLPKGQGIIPLPPFKAWLASNIPAVYDNTMTYYEELCALLKYLQDIVIPAINENADAVTTLSETIEHLLDNMSEILSKIFEEALSSGKITARLGEIYNAENESLILNIVADGEEQ